MYNIARFTETIDAILAAPKIWPALSMIDDLDGLRKIRVELNDADLPDTAKALIIAKRDIEDRADQVRARIRETGGIEDRVDNILKLATGDADLAR